LAGGAELFSGNLLDVGFGGCERNHVHCALFAQHIEGLLENLCPYLVALLMPERSYCPHGLKNLSVRLRVVLMSKRTLPTIFVRVATVFYISDLSGGTA
jgi:hypothetical protein